MVERRDTGCECSCVPEREARQSLTLARIAGHSDPSVTLKVYGHLMRGALGDAADKYEPLLGAISGAAW
jgi:integrase